MYKMIVKSYNINQPICMASNHTQAHLNNSTNPQPTIFIHNLLFPKKSWSEQEDRVLVSVVNQYGPTRWSHIAKFLPHRMGKQCRERWFNHLSPNIKREQWTSEEEWILFLGHTVLGSKWSKLAKLLEGRTDNSIKNHWNSIMRKKIPNFQQKLQQLSQHDVPPQDPQKKAAQLLSDEKKQARTLIDCEDSKAQSIIDSPLLNSEPSSDSLSFSHLLKKIDQKDTLNLQRKESYKYCGWQSVSGQKQKAKGVGQKENRLCQIVDLMQQDDSLLLPLPIKKLSSDYSQHGRPHLQRSDSQLIL